MHESLKHRSHIDFFLVSDSISKSIVNYHVIESAFNFSDHLSIALIIEANFDKTNTQPARNRVPKSNLKYYRWDHGDRVMYYELSREASIKNLTTCYSMAPLICMLI